MQRESWQSGSGMNKADHVPRSCKEYTNMADSPLPEITWHYTTEIHSTEPLVSGQGRL